VSIITAWQCISPEVTVKGPTQWMTFVMTLCGMTVKRMGILGVTECEEDKGTDCVDGDSDI
jgi:hypothetical protein